MLVSVVPVLRALPGQDRFIYAVPNKGQVVRGQVVWIPWRSRTVTGIIWTIAEPPPAFPIKTIVSITPVVLPEPYCQFIEWFAQHYFISLSQAAKFALPNWLRQQPTVIVPLSTAQPSATKLAINRQRLPILRQLVHDYSQSVGRTITTILYANSIDSVVIIRGLLSQGKRLAVVVAEDYQLKQWQQWLADFNPVIVTARENRTHVVQACLSLLHKSDSLYLGTKRLSLFPLQDIDVICLLDPEEPAHKQWDLNPRYYVLTVATWYAKATAARLLCFSQAPTLEQWSRHKIDRRLCAGQSPHAVRLVDMRSETDSLLSYPVERQCSKAQTCLLWLNRKGYGRWLVCAQCQRLATDISVVRCPTCGSQRLVLKGFGTSTLVATLQQRWPSRSIIELHKDKPTAGINYAAKPIIVTTSYGWSVIDWIQVEYCAVISIDGVLAQPEFRSHEHVWQMLVRLRNRSRTGLYIQTYVPEHPFWQSLQSFWPADWYQATAADRQRFGYPPYGERYLIRCRSSGERRLVQTANAIPHTRDWIIDREL